ncbi:hypothetical protein [Corallococcus sp. EGB]|uniref:hypothetical protein n=1 Tax=Corallococcus sp. EGB TaxID=1521117 RepID=UPI001CBD7BB4|nr:hypothetical protein [Corallococcus sp. EGB]
MRTRVLLLLAALFFIHVPLAAHADELDSPMCGTPPRWWWNKNGLFQKVDIRNWNIQQVGRGFQISFDAVNITDSIIDTGPVFTLSHAAVDPAGYRDPSSLTLPDDPTAILGTETLTQGRLPSLRPGQSVTIRAEAEASAFREGANHILTIAFLDHEQVRLVSAPEPTPWFWLRVLQPDERNAQLRTVATSLEPAPSRIPGYEARRVSVTLQNVGSVPLREGTPVAMGHASASSAGGIWSPEDDKGPNDPGNPYAIIFRTLPFRGVLDRALAPGGTITVVGTVYLPPGPCIQQITVSVGH